MADHAGAAGGFIGVSANRAIVDAWREWLSGWSGGLADAHGSPAARRRLIRELQLIAPVLTPEQVAEVRARVQAIAGTWSSGAYHEIAGPVRRLDDRHHRRNGDIVQVHR
jgi:hypothetical protein